MLLMDIERPGAPALEAACRMVPGVPVPEPVADHADATTWVSPDDLAGARAAQILRVPDGGNPAAAVVAYAQGISYAVAGPSVVGSFVAGVTMEVEPARIRLGFGPGGFCERLAVDGPRLVAASPGRFEDHLAEQVVGALEPIFGRAHRLTRVGHRVIWSALSDSIATILLTAALAAPAATAAPDDVRERRHEPPADALWRAWSAAKMLIEAMGRRVPAMSSRPAAFPFTDDDRTAMWLVRGGCCFVYRGAPGAELCVTCPVLDDDKRRFRLRRWARESSLWRRKPSTPW